MTGVWIAYYVDFSSVVPFDEELAGLRYALANGMKLDFVKFGVEVGK